MAQLLSWARQHAPGPRLAACIEGTRSYGAGLARAAAAAGLTVIECEQPTRKARRGKGKSGPIDAHLAVLTALQLDTGKLPTPRADGDREALRILLCARQELTTTAAAQTNRLRALLRDGEDQDLDLARARFSDTVLAALARRRQPRDASRAVAVRQGEIRRLALALRNASRTLKANRAELDAIVGELAPGLTSGPASARSVPPRPSCRSPTPDAAATRPLSHGWPEPARSRHPAARSPATGSTVAATGHLTGPSTSSPAPGCAAIPPPSPTSHAAAPRARPNARSAGASSAISPASSTER